MGQSNGINQPVIHKIEEVMAYVLTGSLAEHEEDGRLEHPFKYDPTILLPELQTIHFDIGSLLKVYRQLSGIDGEVDDAVITVPTLYDIEARYKRLAPQGLEAEHPFIDYANMQAVSIAVKYGLEESQIILQRTLQNSLLAVALPNIEGGLAPTTFLIDQFGFYQQQFRYIEGDEKPVVWSLYVRTNEPIGLLIKSTYAEKDEAPYSYETCTFTNGREIDGKKLWNEASAFVMGHIAPR
jgi:hypothetical protein